MHVPIPANLDAITDLHLVTQALTIQVGDGNASDANLRLVWLDGQGDDREPSWQHVWQTADLNAAVPTVLAQLQQGRYRLTALYGNGASWESDEFVVGSSPARVVIPAKPPDEPR